MTETTQDAYVKGYNKGREDEAAYASVEFHRLRDSAEAALGHKKENSLFKTPDITPAQIVAVVGACLAVAASFGFDISQDSKDSIMQLVSVLASVLIVGDAAVRHGRATGSARKDG